MDDGAALSTMNGIDQSRRIAWARFYQVEKDNQQLRKHNRILLTRLAELVVCLSECEALVVLDEGDEVLGHARRIIASLQGSALGRVILDEVRRKRDERDPT